MSLPAPVYHAHLVAERAKLYLRKVFSDSSSSTMSEGSGLNNLNIQGLDIQEKVSAMDERLDNLEKGAQAKAQDLLERQRERRQEILAEYHQAQVQPALLLSHPPLPHGALCRRRRWSVRG